MTQALPDEPAVLFERWWNGDDAPDLHKCDEREAVEIGFIAGASVVRQSALAFKERAEQLGVENEQLKQQLDVYLARE